MENLNSTNNNDIITFILATQKKTKEEVQAQHESNKTVINNETFFTDNLPEGIMSKDEFKEMMTTIPETQLKAFDALIKAMTENRKINTSEFAQTNKYGNEYYWIKLFGKNGMTEFKVSTFPGLDKLMQGYLFNIYKVSLSLKELYNEAMNIAA